MNRRNPQANQGYRREVQHRGARNHSAGIMAESSVARHYLSLGYDLVAERWRGRSGEVDLVMSRNGETVFVEVKASGSLDAAFARITLRQMRRVMRAATEFVGFLPLGQLTPMRFDLAAVDAQGRVAVRENISQCFA